MSTDYVLMEREFLSSLEPDTGRDLAGWMAAIDAQRLAHRNDIIDWLRQQGFMFAWASWLERIHHNGGRPIYLSPSEFSGATALGEKSLSPAATGSAPSPGAPPRPMRSARPTVVAPTAAGGDALAAGIAAPHPVPAQALRPVASDTPPLEADPAEIARLLSRAKAYRLLGEHLLRQIRSAVPDARIGVASGCIWLSRGAPFAALLVSSRDVRLGIVLMRGGLGAPFEPARLPGGPASISHVAVLTDAREVTPGLLGLVREAAGGAAPAS